MGQVSYAFGPGVTMQVRALHLDNDLTAGTNTVDGSGTEVKFRTVFKF
jgi:hypothetical protein